MVFVCRSDVLLVTLSLCATMGLASYIRVGDTIALQSAPNGNPTNLWISGEGTVNTNNDYTLTSKVKCPWCKFQIMGERAWPLVTIKNNYDIGLRLKATHNYCWLSCKSNGWQKGDKCRSRGCPGADIYADGGSCVSEVFRVVINGGSSGTALRDGQIVQLKNLAMNECVNNRKSEKVDMGKCKSGATYWKIHKLGQ